MADRFPEVQPHGELEKIIDDVWYLTGSVAFRPLVRLPRNMVVVRHGGELTLINSVRLDAKGEGTLLALGKIAHVMKIGFHAMDDAYYVDRFGAKYWSVSPDSDAVTKIDENTVLPFPDAHVFMFKQTNRPEAAILIERDGGLLITCDSVQHWVPKKIMSPLAKVLTRFIGFQKSAQIGPPWRKAMTPEGGSLRGDFERLAGLKFSRLIGGHGGLLEAKANEVLSQSIRREFG